MIEKEPAINWTIDLYGRRGQLERQFWEIRDCVNRIVASLASKRNAIAKLEQINARQTKVAAEDAYKALERVVKELLTIERGKRKLSIESTLIVATLIDSVEKFEVLAAVSKENANELGVSAGDCINLQNEASQLIQELNDRSGSLNKECEAVLKVKKQTDDDFSMYQDKEENLRDRPDSAEDSQSDFGNKLIGFFDSDTEDKLDEAVDASKKRLNENLAHQKESRDKAATYYQLAMFCKNGIAALMDLKNNLEPIATGFSIEYGRVTTAQGVENKLWEGLERLKSNIWSTDFTSTRGNSLGLILQLLVADNEVFHCQLFFEDTKTRIKESIRSKIGANAVEKLLVHIPSKTLGDFVL